MDCSGIMGQQCHVVTDHMEQMSLVFMAALSEMTVDLLKLALKHSCVFLELISCNRSTKSEGGLKPPSPLALPYLIQFSTCTAKACCLKPSYTTAL